MNGSLVLAVLVISTAVLSPLAHAGFTIHGGEVNESEYVGAGDNSNSGYNARGDFRHSEAKLEPRQKRFENAELLVDLAYQTVTERGNGKASVVDGYADDVPFSAGMTMILPRGWQLYRDTSLSDRAIPDQISFLGGVVWPEVLSQLGDRYALQFHIDWPDRVVMMKPGRDGLLANAARIRVIEEPVSPEVTPVAPVDDEQVATVSVPPEPAAPIVLSAGDADGIKAVIAGGVPSDDAMVEAQPVAPVAPMEPVTHTMLVLRGTLFENVVRLSELNGWNPPQWDIDADYRIQADYTINADTFHEAMAKLLLLHPIEADVNLSQRKIYVTREVR